MKKNYQEIKENPALSYISQMNDDNTASKIEAEGLVVIS